MNGIEKITSRIENDARSEAEAVKAASDERCAHARAEYEEKARRAYWAVLHESAKEDEQRASRVDRTARLEAKKSILAMKQELVDAAFDRAVEQLCALPEDEYASLLARLAADAAEGGEKVVLCVADRARVGKKVVVAANRILEERGAPAQLTLSERTRDIRGGVILERGRIEMNCSFESLVEFCRNRLTGEVAGILFEQP